MSIPQSSLNGGGMFKVATRAEMGQVTSGSYFTEVPTANTTQKSLSVCEKTDDNRIMRMLPHRTLRHHWFCSQIHSLVGNRVFIFYLSFFVDEAYVFLKEANVFERASVKMKPSRTVASVHPFFFLFHLSLPFP